MAKSVLILSLLWLGLAIYAADAGSPADYSPDRILIKPKPTVSLTEIARLHAANRVRLLRTFEGIGRLQVLQLPPGANVPEFVTRYQQSGLVEFAEPDYIGHTFATLPNDPKYLDGTLWGLNAIDAPDGWAVLNSASNIVVAIVDTGVRSTHEDLASNMWINPNDGGHGWNALSGTNDPSDDNGHGTTVAGVLGAVGNNGKGVVGVAWKVQIMACKCLNSLGSGAISDVITCLDYARTNRAQIINASFGVSAASQSLSNAVASVRDAGIILVAAAGNTGTNNDVSPLYPASYPFDNVVTVAYTTRSGVFSTNSNYGPTSVHLAAPGEQIFSTFGATDSFYISGSGTSLAAPYVTGALALLRAKYPAEPYQQNIARLLNGADPLTSLSGKCVTGGRLNLLYALSSPIRLAPFPALQGSLGGFHLITAPNRTCIIQASSDLLNWSSQATNTASTNGTFDFFFPHSTNSASIFYRAFSSM
jgi:subtilisin family serine protease